MKAQALLNLRPNALWKITEDVIEWLDEVQTQPTDAEINAEIVRLKADYKAKQYQRDRAKEYPSFIEYLDGVVKGDQAQIQVYIDACQAVKNKYPKGV
jgi:hypothetical protein